MSVNLWVEQYRPKSFDEYVWRDPVMRAKFEEMVQDGALPHLLLEGVAGTGKTSLAYLLLSRLGIGSGDILYINATRERKIEDIQTKIIGFVGGWAINESGIKYIILDEADAMSPLAQRLLRGEMETYHKECRFILTCNYAQKLIPAVHSRCQTYTFKTLDRDDFTARVGEVLVSESVAFEVEDLLALVDVTYPDLRKAINLAQQSSFVIDITQPMMGGPDNQTNERGIIYGTNAHTGERLKRKLAPPPPDASVVKDYMLDMVELFQAGRTNDARRLIVAQAPVEEYIEIYRFLYKNLEIWGTSEDVQDNCLLAIRKGMVNHTIAADPEINLSACLVELKMISNGKL